MTKTALIIYRVNSADPSNLGVVKKFYGQIDGLTQLGYTTDYIIHDDTQIILNGEPICRIPLRSVSLFAKWNFFKIIHPLISGNYGLYIIRYGLCTSPLIACLRELKESNPESKILIDMPTYPYDEEWSGIYGKLALLADRHYRKKLKGIVDFIIHSGAEKEIFDIPVLQSSNGIQTDKIKTRTLVAHSGYNLLAIGKWQYWHGLDRVIKGMADYKQKGYDEVKLFVIGTGPAIEELKSLAQNCGVSDIVQFEDVCDGEKLDDFFDISDLGIGTLGLHRKRVMLDSSLKHRDYVARGLPFVMCGQDSDELEQQEFTFVVSGDDTKIDITELVRYINDIDNRSIISEMRTFAERRLSWRKKMSDLVLQLENPK